MPDLRPIVLATAFLAACSQTPQQPKPCGPETAKQWLAMTQTDLMGNAAFEEFAAGIEAGKIKPDAASLGFVAAVTNLATAEKALEDGEPGRVCLLLRQVRADPRLPIQFGPMP
jgi:hypothetical protein